MFVSFWELFHENHYNLRFVETRLVHIFKQQFSVFLEIRVDKKVYGNICNVV